MNFKFTKEWTKSFFMMIIAVILMGMCVAMLVLSDMGTDPYSAMNYGISARLGMTFGNYQLISNLVLLVLVVIFERKLIGTYFEGDERVLPRSIATKAAFENAMSLDIAMGAVPPLFPVLE